MSLLSALPSDLKLLPWLLCYVVGVLLSTIVPFSASCLFAIIFLLVLTLFLRSRPTFISLQLLLFVSLFVLFGFVRSHNSGAPSGGQVIMGQSIQNQPVVVEGIVEKRTYRASGGTDIVLRSNIIVENDESYPVAGHLLLQVREGHPSFPVGGTIRFWGKLRQPRTFGTPGEFNYPRYLASQGIFSTAAVDTDDYIVTISAGDGVSLHAEVARWRETLSNYIGMHIPSADVGVLRGLLLGEKKMIPESDGNILRQSGLSHLFSVSGMHFGIVGYLLYSLLSLLYRQSERLLLFAPPRRFVPFLIIPFLYWYYELTGGAVPTRRAFLAALITAIALIVSRRVSPFGVLTTLASVMLFVQPLLLFSASFLLSFSGVAGILLVTRKSDKALSSIWGRLTLFLKITLAAAVATAPFAVSCFHQLAPAVVVANLLAVPMVGLFALPLGLVALLLSTIIPDFAVSLLQLSSATVRLALTLADEIIMLPGMGAFKMYPDIFMEIGVSVLALATLLFLARFKNCVIGVLFVVGMILISPLPNKVFKTPRLRLVVFSVGQGASMLVSLPDQRHYLIDGGGFYSDRFDVGERLLLPALGRLGVRRLDAIILTHDHPDHRKGLVRVLEELPVERIYLNRDIKGFDSVFHNAITENGVKIIVVQPGWQLPQTDESLALWLARDGDENNRSIVTYVNGGVLLTGDIEAEGVRELLEDGLPAQISLLKMPHHGSKYSLPEELVGNIQPEISFVSAGYNNRHGLPSRSAVEILERRHIPLFRTDLMGTLFFTYTDEGWRVKTLKKQAF